MTLPAYAVEALRAHRDRQLFERRHLGDDYRDYGLVFATTHGTPLIAGNVRRMFLNALKKADLPVVRFQDLRHTSATLAQAAGAQLKDVSDRLGHSTISITADLYQHDVRQVDESVATRLDALLNPASHVGASAAAATVTAGLSGGFGSQFPH